MPMNRRFNPDIKAALDVLLLDIPGVSEGKSFGYPAYKVNGKVFAWVGGDGIGLKLPRPRVEALIAADDAISPFEPVEGTVWKAWVSIDRAPDAYAGDMPLFEEAIAFVTGG